MAKIFMSISRNTKSCTIHKFSFDVASSLFLHLPCHFSLWLPTIASKSGAIRKVPPWAFSSLTLPQLLNFDDAPWANLWELSYLHTQMNWCRHRNPLRLKKCNRSWRQERYAEVSKKIKYELLKYVTDFMLSIHNLKSRIIKFKELIT